MALYTADWWQWSPRYRLVLTDRQGIQYEVYSVNTIQANLDVLGDAVGQGVFTCFDEGYDLWRCVKNANPSRAAGPRPMWQVSLELENRRGEWGQAWYGLIDFAHKVNDPTQGQQVVLECSSPQKLLEAYNQTPADAINLTVAYALGVTGSAVIRYIAQKVGIPASKLIISPLADVGANTWGQVSASDFTDPTSQSWSAVVQNLQANSGLVSYFDASGNWHWEPVGYLNVPPNPRVIDLADVGHYDLGYSDRGVVTQVEVRYGLLPIHVPPSSTQAAYWTAPASMIADLGTRYLTIPAPYIASNQFGAASWLARVIGQMASANVGQCALVMAADPLFAIGQVYVIPSDDPREAPSLGYLSSIAYNLQYKGPWLAVHGYTYVRALGQSFPYGLVALNTGLIPPGVQAPLTAVPDVNPDTGAIAPGTGRLPGGYTLTQDATIPTGQVSVDPNLGIPVGAQIQLWTSFSAGKVPIGTFARYLVVDASQSDGTIHLSNTAGHGVGYVVITQVGQLYDGTGFSPVSNVPSTQGSGTAASASSPPPSGPAASAPATTNPPSSVPDPGNLTGGSLPTPAPPLVFPVQGYTLRSVVITQPFGPTQNGFEPSYAGVAHFHTGVDLATPGHPNILAAMAGQIIWVGFAVVAGQAVFDTRAADGQSHGADQSQDLIGFGYCMAIRA
ncbi:MAG: hypothetical protein KGL39_37935, partial [Patescibacteria group bacterium]|nr:hypothetical protein [Patescibacteria group bacterium]